jgi:hypothetical protein
MTDVRWQAAETVQREALVCYVFAVGYSDRVEAAFIKEEHARIYLEHVESKYEHIKYWVRQIEIFKDVDSVLDLVEATEEHARRT